MDAGIRQYAVKLVKPVMQTSKDRRVSHAAVVKNKRLGPALALRKLQQELRHETKIQTNSGKRGYRKRSRQRSDPTSSKRAHAKSDGTILTLLLRSAARHF